MTERAKKIYDAWEKEWVKSNHLPNHEHRALAAAILKIIDEFEQYVANDTYDELFVSSNDLHILANQLENLK
jgi:hypothetical protein